MAENYHRQIVLDTETTGLHPQEGHKIIEIGCVELINRRLTGNHFQVYINPQRLIDQEAISIHGLTNDFLKDKPVFANIVDAFINFTKGAELIIHNASFDIGFLNHEYALLAANLGQIEQYSPVFDSLAYARKKHPGRRNSLDALCKRYGIDNSHRQLHGALLDAEILADVYLLMTGGQSSLLEDSSLVKKDLPRIPAVATDRPRLKVIACSAIEQHEHLQRLDAINQASNGACLWITKRL
jgi:DNA polymerase-3 subunit epsilon